VPADYLYGINTGPIFKRPYISNTVYLAFVLDGITYSFAMVISGDGDIYSGNTGYPLDYQDNPAIRLQLACISPQCKASFPAGGTPSLEWQTPDGNGAFLVMYISDNRHVSLSMSGGRSQRCPHSVPGNICL